MKGKRPRKPKGKENLCWAWRRGLKARGLAAEKRRDKEAAEKCRCHRNATTNGRCRLHGGATPKGPASPQYKHGKYSEAYRGIFSVAVHGREVLAEQVTLRDELAISYALVLDKMNAINEAIPAPELWSRARGLVQEAQRLRSSGDRQGSAKALSELEQLLLEQHPPSTRSLTEQLDFHRKMVDTEEKRKDRANLTISVATAMGLVESMVILVNQHVSNDSERAAIGEGFDTLIRRASYPELTDTALGKVH